ncbi:MAG: hypothetical protein CFE32_11910 [Alphaproteobacteria bacterium PA3]|nr:MAG: hypothetical protein CFE32_11910 [Alphaproteobacteria bacterium PA3]
MMGSGGSRFMELAGRMMDSIAEAPQSRRAKPSNQPAGDLGEPTGLSFAETLIGLVQPPSPQEPTKAAPESPDTMPGTKIGPDQSTDDAAVLTDSTATASAVVPALPPASAPINLASTPDPAAAKQEGAGAPIQALDASSAAFKLGLMGDTASNELLADSADLVAQTADASAISKTGETLALPTKSSEGGVKPSADQAAMTQGIARKTQANTTQSLLVGLAALGQTQQPVTEDSQLAQLVATATAPAQTPQPSLQPTDPTTAQAGAAFDVALVADPQGPAAARALEAQSGEARGLKTNGPTGWFANATGLTEADNAGLQSTPSAVSVATANPQASVAAATGLVPNLAKATTKAEETKIAATDAGGLMAGSNGAADAAGSAPTDGTSASVQDTTPKPTLVQPHTIPMLAAAMMRRISNGLKEFTLRLDPPELGRVDVRLTVGTDKKVRAVVSTDRPEALKDLALSARDLTRALQEAGLELEENGLSFSMNDQGSSPQNRDANQQQSARIKHSLDGYETSEAATPEQSAPLAAHLSGPVERWQRARIAMTA